MAIKPTAGHAQHKLSLYFVTSPNATETIDAFGKIRSHVRMTQVLFPIQMIFAFGVSHFTYPYSRGDGL